MIFDTHAHYDDEQFDEDREAVLLGLKAQNICNLVNVGASEKGCVDSVLLSEKYDFIYNAVGIHPEHVKDYSKSTEDNLLKLLKHEKNVAVGEIGLDYYWEPETKENQIEIFKKQLGFARELNKPVIIHSREAAQDTMEILTEYCNGLLDEKTGKEAGDTVNGVTLKCCPGVVHCYSYSPEQAVQYVKMGFYIGIGGVSTFKNGKKLKSVIESVPLTSIVLETDCPYMAPEPFRGKRNYSAYLKYVAEAIATIKGVTVEEVERVTTENARRLYRL